MSDNKNFKGWKVCRFDQIATNVNVRIDNPSESGMEHYVGLEHLDADSLKIRRWGTPDDVEATKLVFKKGDIIFGRRRAYQRKLGIAEFDGICSAHALVLRAKPEVVLPEFLPFFMQSDLFMSRAVEISVGSLSPTINWKTMAMQEFALPPLNEQKRILELLEALQVSLHAYDHAAESARTLLSSVVTERMATAATNYGRAKFGDACVRITDGTHQPPNFSESGVPFLLVSNLSSGKIDWEVQKWVSESEYQTLTKSFKPQQGDVLLTLVGSYGVPVFVNWDRPFTFQRHIGILRSNESKIRGEYLYHFLNSPNGQWQCARGAEGLAQKTITLASLKAFELPLPPLEVQDRFIDEISEYVSVVDSVESRRQESATALRTIRELALGGLRV
ncbi:restriction endonuclease subunit S [Paraburkholderia sediminicola]|uniref:Restriction endonuclease subunit S n=1 Tax=Paraburkholderia rhynchosiae TaxID=487049 RepID=A0ACC7NMN8_9BURK